VLARHEVGALLVMVGDKLVGVLSERDYTRKWRLLARTRKRSSLRNHDGQRVHVTRSSRTRECMALMSQKRIRTAGGRWRQVSDALDPHLMDDIIADHEQTIEH